MKRIAIGIQARMSSTRLPGKSLKMMAGKPLIYWLLKRLSFLDIAKYDVWLLTSSDESDDQLARFR